MQAALGPPLIFAINVAIAWRLFGLEYSAWVNSNEGAFIAIGRVMAEHPFDWLWWPFWDSGLPFQNAYLPFLSMVTAAWTRIAQVSAPFAYHAVTAFFFCLGPAALCWMIRILANRPWTAFLAALAYSVVSPAALMNQAIRADSGGALNLRRLQVLTYYGEGPQTTSLAILPLAIGLLYLAITRKSLGFSIAAGAAICAAVLSNAFGAVTLAIAVVCLLITTNLHAIRPNLARIGAIAALSYAFISPWLPPSLLATIRANSPTVDGDYRYTTQTWYALLAFLAIAALIWFVSRNVAGYLRFAILFLYLISAIVLLATDVKVYLLPQAHRYQLGMEIAICLAVTLIISTILDRAPSSVRTAIVCLALAACAVQFVHSFRYAKQAIPRIDITQRIEYKTARWMNEHLPGESAFISGSNSYLYNVLSDNPQVHGGHEPLIPNFNQRVMTFIVYSGMNAGPRDAEISILWLKAFGAHAITVAGPAGQEIYKPFINPKKFEGVLPVLWREGDDVIYGVPARSQSRAHVVPAAALVATPPIHGLDVAQIELYVKALDDARNPPATFRWNNLHSARIETEARPGHAVSVQVSYAKGWRATANGVDRPVTSDGLGLIAIDPACNGSCTIDLTYTGGNETAATRALSAASLLIVLTLIALSSRRRLRAAA